MKNMKKNHYELAGVDEVIDKINNQIIPQKEMYKMLNISPPGLIIAIDCDEGRTVCTREIVKIFREHNIIESNGGLDEYIELKYDGSYLNSEQMRREVDNAAVYSNYYKGIIAIEPTELSKAYSERVYKDFIKDYAKWSKRAYTIVYVPREPSISETKMINEMIQMDDYHLYITPKKYTVDNLAELCVQHLKKEYDIEVNDSHRARKVVAEYLNRKNIMSVEKMEELSRTIAISATNIKADSDTINVELDYLRMNSILLDENEEKRGSRDEQRR